MEDLRSHLLSGLVIPAHPLALTAERKLDERRQRALTRYYVAAGAGGVAVGVHTTQFAIRDRGLYAPILELASLAVDEQRRKGAQPVAKIAGICGRTPQAAREAETARRFGYDAGLLSLSAWKGCNDAEVLSHCGTLAETIPVFGFYLQAAVGGRTLSYEFWREFAEIPGVVAIKIAPFNRYQTIDVVRAVLNAGRDDIALYTGNDDSILPDLLTPWEFPVGGVPVPRHLVGGLLGHWAVWTRKAVELLDAVKASRGQPTVEATWLTRAGQVTDANAAFFDAANDYRGCIAGLHEVLRRQGLLAGTWCLDPDEKLSPGQAAEIERVYRAYPEQNDDAFVLQHRDAWLA